MFGMVNVGRAAAATRLAVYRLTETRCDARGTVSRYKQRGTRRAILRLGCALMLRKSHCRAGTLLDLRFLELDVLAGDRIVLLER